MAESPPTRPRLYWQVARGIAYDEGQRRQEEALAEVTAALSASRMDGSEGGAPAGSAAPHGWLLQYEFQPVVTFGRSTAGEPLRIGAAELARRGVARRAARRGGEATGHGPGQWTLYPVVPLRRTGGDGGVHGHLRRLEAGVIDWLAGCGVAATRREGLTGVWVGRDKIAAVGVAVSRWVAWHGVAVNVEAAGDVWKNWIIPCGLDGATGGVTTLSRVLGRSVTLEEAREPLARGMARALDMRLSPY